MTLRRTPSNALYGGQHQVVAHETMYESRPCDYSEAVEEEDDEEDDSTALCMQCMEPIKLGHDVTLTELVMPFIPENEPNKILYEVLLDGENEPILEPIFFDHSCFDDLEEALGEQVRDQPPFEEPGCVLTCDYCNSSIRMGERCLRVTMGELDHSRLRDGSTTFSSAGHPNVMCAACAHILYAAADLEGCDSVLSQNGECEGCTKSKCWRQGRCMCRCHFEED